MGVLQCPTGSDGLEYVTDATDMAHAVFSAHPAHLQAVEAVLRAAEVSHSAKPAHI